MKSVQSNRGGRNYFRVGELAARSGRSVHAIRWYEAQGLMPGVLRDTGGRRVYDDRHLSWLELIERLRRTGMSIAQMREYTRLVKQGRTTLAEQRELLRSHRSRVEQALHEWTVALQLLDHKLEFYGEWIDTGRRPSEKPMIETSRRENGAATRMSRVRAG
jgi:DNA-binding transcriptional MerR regulator